MPYLRIIHSGKGYVEHFRYEYEPAPRQKGVRTNFAQRKREELTIDQSLQKRIDNISRAKRSFFRLIRTNLNPNEKPIFITLTTVSQKSLPIAYGYLTEFITRLRKIYGSGFKYLAVPEYQKRGVVHFHCLFWGIPPIDVFNEIPWNVWIKIRIRKPKVFERFLTFCHEHNFQPESAIGLRGLQHQWARGFLDCVPADDSPRLATYMAKYMRKAMSDRRLYQSKSYVCSRNILRPVSQAFDPSDDMLYFINTHEDGPVKKIREYPTERLGKCVYSVYDDSINPIDELYEIYPLL